MRRIVEWDRLLGSWVLLLLAALSVACPAPEPVQKEADPTSVNEAPVRAVVRDIIAADNASDLKRVMALYEGDAVLFPPGENAMQGSAVIQARYETLFKTYRPEILATIEFVRIAGNMAFVMGETAGRLVALEGGENRPVSDTYIMVLRQDDDGSWRISRLMWHPALLSAPPPPRPTPN